MQNKKDIRIQRITYIQSYDYEQHRARFRASHSPPITFRASPLSCVSDAKGLSSLACHWCKQGFHTLNDNPILNKGLFLVYNITGDPRFFFCCAQIVLHSFLTSLILLTRFACVFLYVQASTL